MVVIESGIVTDSRLVHPQKANSGIIVMLSGITIDLRLVQPSNELYPNSSTLPGISTLTRSGQSLKQ